MSAVQEWLNGSRDFAAGLKLYADHGGKAFYLTMFEKAGPSDYNKTKLLAELQKLVADLPPEKPAPKPAPPSLQPTPTKTPPDKAAENRRYLDLLRRKQNLYTELNILITDKRHQPEGNVLRDCAFRILKSHQALTECWALVDYYQEHQCFPTGPEPVKRDDKTAIQYLRQAICRAKDRLKNPKCRNRAATELLLKEKQDQLATLTYKPVSE